MPLHMREAWILGDTALTPTLSQRERE